MKKFKLLLLLFLFMSVFLYSEVVNLVVGVVGSAPITRYDFLNRKRFLEAQARSVGEKVTDQDVYDNLIEEKILYLKLKDYDYEISDRDVDNRIKRIAEQYNMTTGEFEKQIEADNISFLEYKNMMKRQIAAESLYGLVIAPPEISDEEALEFYNKAQDKSFFESDTVVRLSFIYFKATTFKEKSDKQSLAKSVRSEALNGADFALLAEKYSDDPKSKKNGGDIGYHLMADINSKTIQPYIRYGLDLVKRGYAVGTVSAVKESVGSGFWVVKITDIQKDEASIISRVKNYLYEIESRKSFDNWLKEEMQRVSVTIYPPLK